jgi:hypothetical protein
LAAGLQLNAKTFDSRNGTGSEAAEVQESRSGQFDGTISMCGEGDSAGCAASPSG